MKRTPIKEIFNSSETFLNKSVLVKGWVKSLRKSKAFSFVVLNDGSCFKDLQIIVDDTAPNYEEISSSIAGTCMSIEGLIVESGGKQPIEMQGKIPSVIGKVSEDYPLQKKKTSLEFLRDIAHVRARTNTLSAVFRVRHHLAQATHKFFSDQGFYYIHTPLITASDAEGAGELFRVSTLSDENPPKNDAGKVDYSKDYFATETFLACTGQLEAESLALAMGSVYTFGPTFRSENSHTARHLSEFWMIEPEVAFADLDDVADLGARYIQYMIKYAFEHCSDELAFFEKMYKKDLTETLKLVSENDFKKITYSEAIDILLNSKKKFEFKVEWGVDLQTEHERFLSEEHFKGPVIVTDYPKEIKAFYMKLNPDGKTVRAMDILVPGVGEIIGGSQREDDYETLRQKIKACGLEESDYDWYLDLRRFGGAPHSGFGLGFERAIMYITGMSNIRDVIAFPRFPGNAKF